MGYYMTGGYYRAGGYYRGGFFSSIGKALGSVGKALLPAAAPIVGGLIGGPAGVALGGALGGALLGGGQKTASPGAVSGSIIPSPSVRSLTGFPNPFSIPGLILPERADIERMSRQFPGSGLMPATPTPSRSVLPGYTVSATGAIRRKGRRMNVANVRALRRAIRRTKGFANLARSVTTITTRGWRGVKFKGPKRRR